MNTNVEQKLKASSRYNIQSDNVSRPASCASLRCMRETNRALPSCKNVNGKHYAYMRKSRGRWQEQRLTETQRRSFQGAGERGEQGGD